MPRLPRRRELVPQQAHQNLAPSTHSRPRSLPPAASLPAKVVKKILDLQFVEKSEVTLDADIPQIPGRPPAPARLPITEISQWLERYSLMAAILATRFPEKASELFAYQATIVQAERNYEGKQWVAYDRQFLREALACKDLDWSVTDPRLYNEAFTGRARSIPRCTHYLQDDHASTACPRNPNRPWFGWFPDPASYHSSPLYQPPLAGRQAPTPSPDICRRYNEGRCKHAHCRYLHLCKECYVAHPWIARPRNTS